MLSIQQRIPIIVTGKYVSLITYFASDLNTKYQITITNNAYYQLERQWHSCRMEKGFS
jgi:hypothetical protein